jgi:gluconokinase
MVIVLCGVTGVGKTTIGKMLARELGWTFHDADDLHPSGNIEKMRSGIPLTDEDRVGWLDSLRELIRRSIENGHDVVLACSALKEKYRDRLHISEDVRFVLLQADPATIALRLAGRTGHFMAPDLIKSQFDTLEPASARETVVDATLPPETIVDNIKLLIR